jgi:hypothetical protein
VRTTEVRTGRLGEIDRANDSRCCGASLIRRSQHGREAEVRKWLTGPFLVPSQHTEQPLERPRGQVLDSASTRAHRCYTARSVLIQAQVRLETKACRHMFRGKCVRTLTIG